MSETMKFPTREAFREWLRIHCESNEGIWLLFDKQGNMTLKASEALEEALCFGWIDGVMKSIDEQSYMKYFSQRRKNSKWSKKNKTLIEKLEKDGKVSEFGRTKVKEAKQNGQWNAPEMESVTDEEIQIVCNLLSGHEPAYTNFVSMSLSVQKTYTRAFFDAKTPAGRDKRLVWMLRRLNKNLKPM